jgi:adenylate cyclase class IV
MEKVTEIELRGRLSDLGAESLKKKLVEIGKFKETKNRVLIDYTTFLVGETIESRTKDIRVRNTNGISEIIVKTGNWGGADVRDEFKVNTSGSFDSLVKVMDLLGYSKGVLCIRNSEVYQLDEVEFSIVEVPGHSYYFEAEIETTEEVATDELKNKITEKLLGLDLAYFTDEEFFEYIKELNSEANIVFDSTKEPADYFRKKFSI